MIGRLLDPGRRHAWIHRVTAPERFDLRPTGAGRVLGVGCGSAKYPGAVGIDVSPHTEADVVHDLDVFPYPFEDASFDHVLMQDVLSADAIRSLAQPRFAHYSSVRLRVVHVTIDLWFPFRALGIDRLVARWPMPYEAYFAFRFPAMNIRAELEVLGD